MKEFDIINIFVIDINYVLKNIVIPYAQNPIYIPFDFASYIIYDDIYVIQNAYIVPFTNHTTNTLKLKYILFNPTL